MSDDRKKKKILAGAKDIHKEQAQSELAPEHPGPLRWLWHPRAVPGVLRVPGCAGIAAGIPGTELLSAPGRVCSSQHTPGTERGLMKSF